MKPLAILKDSLREAWDSKTLLVMLIMAALFLIVVGSIGYTPAPPRTVFENHLEELSSPAFRVNRGKISAPITRGEDGGPPVPLATFDMTTFKIVKEASHEPNASYEYTILVKPGGPKGKKDNQPAKGEKDIAAPPPEVGGDRFDKLIALWHEDGSGNHILVEGKELDVKKLFVKGPVTDEMVREFFAVELNRSTQVPIVGFERLPAENPGERVYKVTTGPSNEPRVWPVRFSLLFGLYESETPLPLGIILYIIQDLVISSVGGLIILLIAVIVTAFFIPNMLRPGSVVMLLSKPINRTTLLLFKYFGGLFFVLILSGFVVGGVWLITGLRAGVWAPGVFAVVPLLTLTFSILYAVSTLAAVWTRNSIVSILVTLVFAGLLWIVGKVEGVAKFFRLQEDAIAEIKKETPKYPVWTNVSETLNRVLPRWHDIDVLTGQTVAESLMTISQQETRGTAAAKKHSPSWGGTIGVTGLWIVAFLALACWRFSVKDF